MGRENDHFFHGMSEGDAEALGQEHNRTLRKMYWGRQNVPSDYAKARGVTEPSEDRNFMKHEFNWSDEEWDNLAKNGLIHTAPRSARANIAIHGLRPALTTTVGDSREKKQRYGIFLSKGNNGYSISSDIPDSTGRKVADVYKVFPKPDELRMDPYGYPYVERSLKPHEITRIGHNVSQPGSYGGNSSDEYHEGNEETCTRCHGE